MIPHILHVHSTFSLGGKEARAVRLMNAFGDSFRHSVISAVPDALGARAAIDPEIRVDFPGDHPSLVGKPGLGRYRVLGRYMRGFDLVLSYNWGAMDMVGARRLFGGPPLIHHEDGFNHDEVTRQKPARIWFRRLMLPAARAVVVPSMTLEAIARQIWRQPSSRIMRIANGIPLARFQEKPEDNAIPGFMRAPARVAIGTVAGLRAVKNLPRLVRAFAQAGITGDLVIVGEGPEADAIRETANAYGVAQQLHMAGFLADPARFMGIFDIFALSSDSEQQPISLIEAMAAGLPVVATDVGDIRHMVSMENRPFIVPAADETGFSAALRRLAADPALRREIGAANQHKALRDFDEAAMIARYRDLYDRALSRSPGAPD